MNINGNKKGQEGYIALMSAIIISAVLVGISVSISTTGFFVRFNVLDAEYKLRSAALAESCVNVALLRLAQNPGLPAAGSVAVGNEYCNIVSVRKNGSQQIIIQTKGVVREAVSNLQVVISSSNFSLISWEEIPVL